VSGYGALQSGSNDAGSWQLIEQVEPGEWAPLARGGKQNIIKLAAALNGADRGETETQPAGAITREEVLGWDEQTYMAHRGRLWLNPPNDYRDGSYHGRPYTGPAAQVMTGPPNSHPAMQLRPPAGPTGMQLTRLADAARAVVATWYENPATDLAKEWPAMARLQQLLDENERQQ
jgi:hypothetical protein